MRDQMQVGDFVLFYHSNCKPPGVVGLARVCKEAYPDFTAWDPKSKYFDKKSSEDKPTWLMVDVEYIDTFPETISLSQLKAEPALKDLLVTRKGMRLSIQPVEKEHFVTICQLAGRKAP